MTAMEREILEECAGLRPERPWGAAVGECLETLFASGYIKGFGDITEKGMAALESAPHTPRRVR